MGWQLGALAAVRVAEVITVGHFVYTGTEASVAWIFAKKAKASYTALATSKNQAKHPGSSWGKDLTEFDNGQKHLTDW